MAFGNEPPVVDISALRAGDGDVGGAIDRACRDIGFFVVVGHGLDAPMRDLLSAAHGFFAQSQDEKERTPFIDRHGYVPADDEALDRTRPAHRTEYLDVGLGDEVPLPDLPGFTEAVRAYQRAALPIGTLLLRVLGHALGAPTHFFDERMTSPQCRLRFLHYRPVLAAADGTLPVPTKPHTDYGALTLLATDGVAGLEVQPIGGEWTPVQALPGSLVVNLGDMLARWTNDVYRSTPHRVVGSTRQHRYSIPFFVNPDPDTIVDCIPSCSSTDRPARYAPIRAGDYLAARIDGMEEPYVDPDAAPARLA